MDNDKMKPIIIVPEGSMKPEDIARLNENGICTVESKEPGGVKFLDPIPSMGNRSKIESAAIQLSRKLLTLNGFPASEYHGNGAVGHEDIAKLFVELLIKGTPLDPTPSDEETSKRIFDSAKAKELQRLAAEEAQAEHAAAKAAKKKPTP